MQYGRSAMAAAPAHVRCIRRRLAAAILVGLVGALAGAVVAGGAQSAHDRSGGRLLRLAPGDQIAVAGTNLHCAVSSSGGPTTIACGSGSGRSPRAGSYGLAVADTALLVLKTTASSTPAQVRREAEPSGSGATFPGPAAGGRSFRAVVGTVATVTGTHVFCAVERLQGTTYVTCGPADGSARFFVKSYVGAVSDTNIFVIRKLDQKRTTTVFQHRQP